MMWLRELQMRSVERNRKKCIKLIFPYMGFCLVVLGYSSRCYITTSYSYTSLSTFMYVEHITLPSRG